jgi:signal transduction histidine kinase/ligand-binding sensor domain-containing protein/DNA-binding response OmpR family regulator
MDTNEGLSSNSVYSIYKDKIGFIWIATSNGLDRYDGIRTKHYSSNFTNSVWLYYISKIQEDTYGNLILKRNNYIVYNRRKDNFYKDIVSYLNNIGFYCEKGPNIIITGKKGDLWLSYNHGIYHYDMICKKRFFYPLKNVSDIMTTKDRAYIILKKGMIISISTKNGEIHKDNSFSIICKRHKYNDLNIFIDKQNQVWVYSKNANDGLFCQQANHCWKHLCSSKSADYRIRGNQICAMAADRTGNIWIAMEHNGIDVFSKKNNHVIQLSRGYNGIISDRVNTLYCDEEGTMWIGYLKNGISYYTFRSVAFETHSFGNSNASEYENDISALMADKDGNIWAGTDGYGLYKLNSSLKNITHYHLDKKKNIVSCLYQDRKGKIWIGTFEDGIYCIDKNRWTHITKGNLGLEDNNIWSITEDDKGTLWIGGLNEGPQKWNDEKKRFDKLISKIWLSKLCKVKTDKLYIATFGYSIIDTKKMNISPNFTCNKKNTLRFSDEEIRDMYYDSRGLLWLCGKRGLSIYDQKTDTVYYITQKNGLCNDITQAITEDLKKDIWITTENGISQIITRKSAKEYTFFIKNYSGKDGLPFMSFNQKAICTDKIGNVYVGGTEGLCVYRVNRPVIPANQPTVLFTDIQIGNEFIIPDSVYNGNIVLKQNISKCHQATFNYSDRMITFFFASPGYSKSSVCRYAYKMESSLPSVWIYTSEDRVMFDNLNPGHYVLKIKACNNDGIWSKVSSINILVRPPFWASWWAFILYICFASATVLYLFYVIRRRQKEKMHIQKIKMELDKQRHINNMKLEFFTNVSHDFRTPLSLIITPIEKLLDDYKDKTVAKTLSTIHRNAMQLTDMVNQLLNFTKLDEASETVVLTHCDYISFVKEICDAFSLYQKKKMISLNFSTTIEELFFDFDQDKVRKIMMNLLSNAFKFSKRNSVVFVVIDSDNDEISTSVNDNGIGIPDYEKKKVFERFYQVGKNHLEYGNGIGLHIVSQYVSLLNGKITLTDNMPCGCRFCFTLPIIRMSNPVSTDDQTLTTPIAKPSHNEKTQQHILIVEDNDDFLNFMDECLNDIYLISKASNGIEALKVLQQKEIDLIISDIMMPVMDGLELCKKVKTDIAFSHIPIILLTARTTEEHKLEGLRDGADDYLTKPFNLNILKLRIEKLLQWNKDCHKIFTNKMEIKPEEITISSLDEELIKRAIKVVEDNMDNSEFSVIDLGRAIGLSRGHLYRKLMEITGRGPLDFIRILRLKRAKQYLKESQMTVSEIAYIVGFNTPKLFSKYFKEEFKISPSDFKGKSTS